MQYFKLFENHIPTGIEGNILLVSIGNPDCISYIINLNPNAIYYVYDSVYVNNILSYNNAFKITFNNLDNDNLEQLIDNIDMKFDCIIMNPPYQRNLHLKILAEAIKHLKDDGTCVNLSPVRWLQDPLAKYKKHCDLKRFEESVAKHIENLDVVDGDTARELFQMNIFNDIGIYLAKKNPIEVLDYSKMCIQEALGIVDIYKKIFAISRESNFSDKLELNKEDGWRVMLNAISGQKCEQHKLSYYKLCMHKDIFINGCNEEGKKYSEVAGGLKKANAKKTGKEILLPLTVKFDTKEEAVNFKKYCECNFMTFCNIATKNDMHPQFKFLPFLGDAVNPRTGLKGYFGEWTNDDLYKFFNITPEEQKVIEDTMKKYA